MSESVKYKKNFVNLPKIFKKGMDKLKKVVYTQP